MDGLYGKDVGTTGKRFVNTTVTAKATRAFTVRQKHRIFPGNTIKLSSSTCILFSSGKLVIVGAKSQDKIDAAIHEITQLIGPIKNVSLKNVVGSCSLGHPINLIHLHSKIESSYEPELFTGLVTKVSSGATCLIFHTGKIIVTGTRTFDKCEESLNIISELIHNSLWKHS